MADETFICPECQAEGKETTFTRPQSLGAHRWAVHGVKGKSAKSQERASRRAQQQRPLPRGATPPTAREREGAGTNGAGQVNRDHLLETIFPEGMPPREDVLHRATDWLDEAERLAMPVKR